MSINFNVSAATDRGIAAAITGAVEQAISFISEKHGLDSAELMAELNLTRTVSKAATKSVAPKKKKPTHPIPFCDHVFPDQCFGIRVNHGLHTQCGQSRSGDGDYCKTCSKQASTNESSKPNAGDIRVRALGGDWVPVGKLVSYGNVMAKLGISKEQAEAEADAQGVTIPESEFAVVKRARGRPKKESSSSDDEEKPKRARGRPKKSKKVVSASAGDDLISQLVAAAQSTSDSSSQSDSDSSAISEKLTKCSPKKLSAEEKAEKLAAKEVADADKAVKLAAKLAAKELADAAKAEAKAAKLAAKKLADAAKVEEKAAKLAAKELADAAKAEEKAAKLAAKELADAAKAEAKAAKLAAKELADAANAEAKAAKLLKAHLAEAAKADRLAEKESAASAVIETAAAPELTTDGVFDDSSGSDDDGEATVEKFSHNGKDYLLEVETNELYDQETHEQVGVWDPVNSIIADC